MKFLKNVNRFSDSGERQTPVSETKTQRKLFPLYITSVLWIKKITNLCCRLSSCQATIINLLNNKSKNYRTQKIK